MATFYIEDKVGVSITDGIPHYHTENTLKRAKTKKCGYVSIKMTKLPYLSSIVFHTVILNMLLKMGENKKMWLRSYIEDTVGVSIINSIPHCHTEML